MILFIILHPTFSYLSILPCSYKLLIGILNGCMIFSKWMHLILLSRVLIGEPLGFANDLL